MYQNPVTSIDRPAYGRHNLPNLSPELFHGDAAGTMEYRFMNKIFKHRYTAIFSLIAPCTALKNKHDQSVTGENESITLSV